MNCKLAKCLLSLTLFSTAFASAQDLSRFVQESSESFVDSVIREGNVDPVPTASIPTSYLTPSVFDYYRFLDKDTFLVDQEANKNLPDWLVAQNGVNDLMIRVRQNYMLHNPDKVVYNASWLPEPPKHYNVVIDPMTRRLSVQETRIDPTAGMDIVKQKVDHKNWIHSFTGTVQFSQAYISPNWYQGGNNNLNMIANAIWNVKLNQAYHPKLLFESTIQYKLGMNSAPDDSLRNYSISEDLFQVNSTFGVKARDRWYYSVTTQFKTQLLNSYTSNTNTLRSAFLSPAELNVGVGMTYNYANKKKTFTFDASLAPLSYNMRICTNSRMDETNYNIAEGHKTVSQYGSTAELKMTWKICYNINYTSRVYVFTNYDYLQADWENTLSFTINEFLSTQIYAHARYDTTTPKVDDNSKWKKLQFKEILSFGFAYKFATN